MRKMFFYLILFCVHTIWGQTEWHVRPYPNNYTNPSGANGLSFATAWCLQYALSGGLNGNQIQPGDVIWLHGVDKATYVGTPDPNLVYKGHFKSNLTSTDPARYITVSSFPGEWAVIDGNIHNGFTGSQWGPITPTPALPVGSSDVLILEVRGRNVTFQDFEITCLKNFSRIKDMRFRDPFVAVGLYRPVCSDPPNPPNPVPFNFHEYVGIQHYADDETVAIKNNFRNLVIRNIPGNAMASWKFTLDSEIYGNIFYNNGIIEVIGEGCLPPLENYLANTFLIPDGPGTNCRGHQTAIYTQNANENILKKRVIRNNIFLNNYDSGIGIWSASEASIVNYLKNYTVSKNVLVNNGSQVPDETANMIISTNAGESTLNSSSARNIDVDSNVFYRNKTSPGTAGILVKGSENINITNNFIFGYIGMELNGQANHKITFRNNLFAGTRINVITSIANYKLQDFEWNMNYNLYYTREIQFFKVPQIPFNAANSATRFLSMNDIRDANGISSYPTWFRHASEYAGEQNSTRDVLFYGTSSCPPQRILINQNKYDTNKFYVYVYNPREYTAPETIIFSNYGFNVPSGKKYSVKDAQNYFNTIISQTYDINNGIQLPLHSPNNFEDALPTINTVYGPAYVSTSSHAKPIHSNIDFNTYVIEFECSTNLAFNLIKSNYIENTISILEARNRITFGSAYTANIGANVTAIAEKEILIIGNSWIKNGANFLGKINPTLCSIALNEALESGSYNTNPTNIPPSAIFSPQDPPFVASRIRSISESGRLILFPNPNNGIFNVENGTSKKIIKAVVNRIDSGKLVLSNDYDFQGNIIINISREQSGLYTVQIYFEDGDSNVIKIIKK